MAGSLSMTARVSASLNVQMSGQQQQQAQPAAATPGPVNSNGSGPARTGVLGGKIKKKQTTLQNFFK
jgi:hypothetical protein